MRQSGPYFNKTDLYGCIAAALLGLFLWSAMTLSGEVRLDTDKGVALTVTCAAMMLLIPIYYLRFGFRRGDRASRRR